MTCNDCIHFTLNQLLIAVTGCENAYSYKRISWVQRRGLPIHTQRVNNCTFKVVHIDEFWEWAEKNRSFIDFSKMEPLILGEEPDWVANQRRHDFEAFALQRKDKWTSEEDSRLKMLLREYKYGYAELSEMLHRSAGAIQRRCSDLNIKERPIKAENHGPEATWTNEMFRVLADGIKHGESYTSIGALIGKSEKAIRGKVYAVYSTENADKVRAMMKDGKWGFGAPIPTVRKAMNNSGYRAECKKEVALLLSVIKGMLKQRVLDEGFSEYWQKDMCMNWDDFKGCTAGETNCDECLSFQRIKPQYCARCGKEFLERVENRFCSSCRNARKKQAQRHWAKMNGKRLRSEDK